MSTFLNPNAIEDESISKSKLNDALKATDGKWLFNGEGFAKEASGFGDLSKWEEVPEEFKTQWEEEHKDNEEIAEEIIP